MDRAEIKKVARRVDRELRKKPRKSNRTLSLTEDTYVKLQSLCKAQEISTSEAVDRLIEGYVGLYD